jgi:ribonuclease Z
VKSIFHPSLVNDPFEDPSVYVDIPWERRGLLFDLGANYHLPTRKLLKVSDVFVSHTHIDHFIGFDHLLRQRLARDRPLRLFGPPGITDRVTGKLSGYTWNLVKGYPFVVYVIEIGETHLTRTRFEAGEGFQPHLEEESRVSGYPLRILEDDLFVAETTLLDHRIHCGAYAVSERLHVNIHRDVLERRGLPVGEWLRSLKEHIRAGAPDEALIEIPGHGSLLLGELSDVVSLSPGQKIVYVVDAAFHQDNIDLIVALATNADLFFVGAPFLERDAERARATRHLTARQAGWLARRAGARRLEVFHFSPRYDGDSESLIREAEEAFSGRSDDLDFDDSFYPSPSSGE